MGVNDLSFRRHGDLIIVVGQDNTMVAARILTDLIAGRDSQWAELYSPRRTGKLISMAIEKAKDTMKSLLKGDHFCTHMGCLVIYNPFDETYDCPCHGSRFDKTGKVLWGPAVKPIQIDPQKRR